MRTEIRWCKTHDEYVAGENNHCGCEYSEGCWFDNDRNRGYLSDGNTPNCQIVIVALTPGEDTK